MGHDTLRITTVGPADPDPQTHAQAAFACIYPGVSVLVRADFDSALGAEAAITLGNVVPFQRMRKESRRQSAPSIQFAPSERPAPSAGFDCRGRAAVVLALSLLAHATVFATFNRPVPPKASIGVEIITAEIVLGAEVNAGLAATPSRSEDAQNAPAAEANSQRPAEATKQPAPEPETVAKPLFTAPETPQPAMTEPEPAPEPPQRQAAETRPKQKVPAPKPEPRREKKTTTSPVNSAPSMASSGIGRGRSDTHTNYRGLIAAHLARHKQFPPDARRLGDQGGAVVAFKLDGTGRVASVKLVRPIGVDSLDREVVSMVNRASPFPAPPDGRPQSFTVPVSFQISGR